MEAAATHHDAQLLARARLRGVLPLLRRLLRELAHARIGDEADILQRLSADADVRPARGVEEAPRREAGEVGRAGRRGQPEAVQRALGAQQRGVAQQVASLLSGSARWAQQESAAPRRVEIDFLDS